MRRSGHDGHLGRMAVGDDRRTRRPGSAHDRDEVVDPPLDGLDSTRGGPRHSNPPHVEPEHASDPPQPVDPFDDERLFGDGLEVASPVENEDDVTRAVVYDLVRDVDIAAADVPRAAPSDT